MTLKQSSGRAAPARKGVLALAVLSLTLCGSQVFAKSGPGHPTQVKTSGTSATPSGSGGGGSQRPTFSCAKNPVPGCRNYSGPGHTQPTCLGPHRGPNGVMIQCD